MWVDALCTHVCVCVCTSTWICVCWHATTSFPYQAQLWQPGPLISLQQIWHCLSWQPPDERNKSGATLYQSLPPIGPDKSTTPRSVWSLLKTTQWDVNHMQRLGLWACAKGCLVRVHAHVLCASNSSSNQWRDWKRHVAIKPNKMSASPY